MYSMSKLICPFCSDIFTERGLACHLTRTHDVPKEAASFLVAKLRFNIDQSIIDNIVSDYREYSVLYIKAKYDIPYKVVVQILQDQNINIRNISDTENLLSVKDKRKLSLLEKFGVDNASKSEIIKNKKKETFIKHYGVDNIWKAQQFKDMLNELMLEKYGKKRIVNIDKMIETNMDRYGVPFASQKSDFNEKREATSLEKFGVPNPMQSDLVKTKRQNTIANKTEEERLETSNNISNAQKLRWENMSEEERTTRLEKLHNITLSAIEKQIGSVLLDLGLGFEHNFYIHQKDHSWQYDYRLTNISIIIEVNGDYWHANPNKYKSDDQLIFPGNITKTAKQIWKKDRLKSNIAKHYGYKVLYFWEHDILELSPPDLKIKVLQEIISACEANEAIDINDFSSAIITK